jgi:asparaginyl-tRNA synthetase
MTFLANLTESLGLTDSTAIHICEVQGDDTSGTGTAALPFLTCLRAVEFLTGTIPEGKSLLVRKSLETGYADIAGAALKKAKKGYEINLKKIQKAEERALVDAADSEKLAAEEAARIEKAKSVVLVMDETLSAAKTVKIDQCEEMRGKRVAVSGWVHRSRVQGKDMMFIVLRDGYGFLQCVLTGRLV